MFWWWKISSIKKSLDSYSFPASTERNQRFQRKWLLEYPWLSYSESEDGSFCLFCCLFSSNEVGKGGHATVSALVTVPFMRWKNAKEQFKYHQELQYHKNAVISSQHFMSVFEKKIVDNNLQLDSDKKKRLCNFLWKLECSFFHYSHR